MAIASYAELLGRLGQMVSYDFDNAGTPSVAALQASLEMAEFRIYREVRTSFNTVAFGVSDVIASGVYTLPARLKAVNYLHFGKQPVEPVSPSFLRSYVDSGNTGDVLYFSNVGGTLEFAPAVANGTQLQGNYYAALPALDATTFATNTLFAAAADLFLFAAMVEVCPLFGQMDQVPIWNTKYQMVRDALNQEERMTSYASGRPKRRASTTLMG